MKRIFAMFAVLALVAGMAMAAPSMYGSNGLIRTISPTNCGPMSWSVGARGFMSMGDIDTNLSWMNIDAVPTVNFSFSDMLELSVAPTYTFNQWSMTTPDTSAWTNGSRDTRFGVKATFIRGEGFNLGTYLGYDFRWSKKFSSYYAWDGSAFVKDSNYTPMGAIHFVAIPGFDMGAAKLNLNVGLDYDLDKYEVGTPVVDYVYPKMAIPFGLGFSYKASDMMTPFVEVTGSYVMDTNQYYQLDTLFVPMDSMKRGLMNNPLWITGGLRFAFGNVKMDVGGEYNLQSDDTLFGLDRQQDWQVFMGLSYGICNLGPKAPVTAILTGKVTDAKGKGLAATVTAGGLTANTDPATGVYTIKGLPITKMPTEIKAVAKLYDSKSGSVILVKKNKNEKTPAVQDFALNLTPIPPSVITGKIINYKSGEAVPAVVTFKGAKTVTATADANGSYTAKLEPGTYTATVAAEGFNEAKFNVVAKDGQPVTQNTGLVKKKEVFAFSNINFAAGKAVVTPEIEKALQPLLKVLLDNPEMKVEIAGHTDAMGSKVKNLKLSQDRADAVVAWLITNNVKAQMTSKGYGSSMPIADNKTKANRALNRRIEIKVAE